MGKTINKCKHCVKRKSNNNCLAFKEPEYQWRKNKCYGYTDNIWDLRRIFNAIWGYGSSKNRVTAHFLREISDCISYHTGE